MSILEVRHFPMKFKESALAHKLLDGLEGIEIGGSAHNSFGLKTRNVDYRDGMTIYKEEEIRQCGQVLPVDILAPGDELPLADNSVDFVLSSHVIEHFPDPIKALKEWRRVVRPGGDILFVNHFAAEGGPRWWVERAMAPASRRLGWHPDFSMRALFEPGEIAGIESGPMPPFGIFTLVRLRN